ncbi:MAG TPA: hypothetical protein VG227_08935, partial [Caulobacteraceae bacterium]|nr:hypothetical protein [Caulobacteraceae bacterium]
LRGFYETAGGVKRFLFFPSLEVFAFAFVFVLVCQIHLGLLYALEVSLCWLGACWGPMVMNRGCYLKRGLLRPSPCAQSPGHEMDSEIIACFLPSHRVDGWLRGCG